MPAKIAPTSVGKTSALEGRDESFLRFLVQQGLLPPSRIDALRKEVIHTKRPLVELLMESGIMPEEKILSSLSKVIGVPYRIVPPEFTAPAELLRMISEEAVRMYQFVPLGRDGSILDVGMLDPNDVRSRDALRFLATRADVTTNVFLISPAAFQHILKLYRTLGGEVRQALQELEQTISEAETPGAEKKRKTQEMLTEEAPIIKMVAVMLKHAAEGRASDIHIEPTRDRLRIRFRVDGVLYTSLFLPIEIHPAIISRIKILSNLKIDETRVPQDGRFRATLEGKEIDFRLTTYPTTHGEKVAIRLLDPTIGLKSLVELGLEGKNKTVVEQAMKRPFGAILITGPTGSGKSTTLYAMLKLLNSDQVNILTLEDPVEYYLNGVNQSQVREEIGYSFATGLRHMLRGDPNIMMVGEIRDTETAKLAVHAALTGHIVLSTLHTNNAAGVVPRLVDMGVDPYLLPSTLAVAVAQRLVQRLCPDCKAPRDPSPQERAVVESALVGMPEDEKKLIDLSKGIRVFESPGCPRCAHRGTKGRMAIFEAFRMTRELEGMIVRHELTEARLGEETKRQGMVSMLQDGIRKVLFGQVSLREVMRVVHETEL